MQRTTVICMGRGWWRGCERGYSYCTCCVAKVFPAEMSFKGKRGGNPLLTTAQICANMCAHCSKRRSLETNSTTCRPASFCISPYQRFIQKHVKIPACFTASVLLLPCTNQNSCMVLPTRSPAEIIATKCHIKEK